MQISLAQALLRRKELAEKTNILKHFQSGALFEVRSQRVKAHEGIDEVTAQVPKLTASQVTAEYDWNARQLRLIDAHIQKANWDTMIEVEPTIMGDFSDKDK